MAPNVSVWVFERFLSRAYKICSERCIDEGILFLIDVFTENGYERKTLEKITKNYLNKLQNPPVNNTDSSEVSVKLSNFHEYSSLVPNQGKRLKRRTLRPFLHQVQI